MIRCCYILWLLLAAVSSADITVDFPVVQDSWVNYSRTTRNYGSDSYLQIKANETRIPYLQFQTYGITGNVVSARLYVRYLYSDNETIYAHKVADQTWDENVITYDTKPVWNTTATGSTTLASGWISIPVTADITGNGLYSYALLGGTGVNGDIYSKESGYTPSRAAYLRVVYQDVNLAPIAQAESYNVLHNTLREVATPGVLGNDSDPNGDPITAQVVTGPTHGALNLAADGSFTYMPASGYSGTDTFTYQAVDANPLGALASAPATVTLTVLAAGVGQMTAAEISRIQSDLGVSLDLNQQIDLATLVKPVTSEAWRIAADARVEQHRKANLTVTVVSNSGAPIAGATVRARLKNKAFKFGGVLDLTEFSTGIAGGMSSATYRAIAPKYFDAVGLNNGLKPRQSFYQNPPVNADRLETDFFPWCASINMPCRGHLLQWPGLDHMSAPVEAKVVEIETVINGGGTPTQTQLDELRALVDNEITTWAARWPVYEWDVVNEVLTNHRIQDILGPDEIVRWFQLAQTASTGAGRPGTGRLINEYQIISANAATNGNSRIAGFKTQVEHLINQNAAVTGLGFQSRFRFRREEPALLYSRLEMFAPYGKDMAGTEFEVMPSADGVSFVPDETLRAQMTEEVMTTYFSHPKVTGLFAWEYASVEDRALLTVAGAPKLNALVWYYLNRIRYHTDTTLTTDSQGQVNLRGFKGDYEITVETGGAPIIQNHTLSADSNLQIGTTVASSTTHTLDVIEDTFAQQLNPNTLSNFASIQLRKYDNGTNGRLGFLKFNLPVLTGTVQSATLVLHSIDEPHAIQALAVSDNTWAENTLTWNNRPAVGALLGTSTPTAPPAVIEIPLSTSAIPTTGGNFSLALNETGNSYGSLASSENTSGYPVPKLVIVTGSPDNDGDGIADGLDPDDDNDGIPDAHEILLGLDPFFASDASADPDGDGFPTRMEYALGGNPSSANRTSDFISISRHPGGSGAVDLTIRRRTGLTNGPVVTVGSSSSLGGWFYHAPENLSAAGHTILNTTTTSASDAIGPVETLTITLSAGGSRGFFRLRVE